jgi:ribonuclease HI
MPKDGPSGVALPVARLLEKLNRISTRDRHVVWSVYRHIRRAARRRLSERVVYASAASLVRRVQCGERYAVVALGLKLAATYTLVQLRAAGALARAERAVAKEAFHLIRLELRSQLGMRPAEEMPSVRFGSPGDCSPVEAWSDGGVRAGRSAAGLLVAPSAAQPGIELARYLPHRSPLSAELQAAHLALETLLSAGVQHARLNVDSLGVLRAFQGRLALRFCVEEALLLQLAEAFAHLEVRLIPRAFNQHADSLATGLLLAI